MRVNQTTECLTENAICSRVTFYMNVKSKDSMTTITEQLDTLHADIEVLSKIKRQTMADTIMQAFEGSNIKTLVIKAAQLDNGRLTSQISVCDEVLNDGDMVAGDGLIHHRRPDGTFDMAEHGNASVKQFLDFGIEWNDLMVLVNEIAINIHDIMFVFEFEADNRAGLYITADGYWVAEVLPIDISDTAPQSF